MEWHKSLIDNPQDYPPKSLPTRWRRLAASQRQAFGDEKIAKVLEFAAGELESALLCQEERLYTLKEASAVSGFAAEHLGRLVRDGAIPNSGRKYAPRIAAGDLPRKKSIAPSGRDAQIDSEQIVRSAIDLRRS